MTIFSAEARATFAANYPEVPHKLPHELGQHPLLELDALAALADHSLKAPLHAALIRVYGCPADALQMERQSP